MKKLFIFGIVALFIVGFTSCGGKETKKSKECDITLFTAGGIDWEISGLNISATFPKGASVNNLIVTIQHSDMATVVPASGTAADFSGNQKVTYTVTAQDGVTKKVYTAQTTVPTSP